MRQAQWPYRLAWILIIILAVTWVSLFIVGLLSNLIVGFLGLLVLVLFVLLLIKLYKEQGQKNDYYSKHVDK